MGGGFYFIDILIFAMIAAFLVYRLRGVLGRRHGEERQRPNPYTFRPGQEGGDNVVTLPDRGRLLRWMCRHRHRMSLLARGWNRA